MDTAATSLLNAIVAVKRMYDQHLENAEEVKEVQAFLDDYQELLSVLQQWVGECEGNNLGGAALKLLEGDLSAVTNKLVKYAKNSAFFSIFPTRERMQELQKLHRQVMASVQINTGIASLSFLLDARASQVGLVRSTSELKSLVTTSIARMSREVAREVRAEVVQARRTSFAENEKFWADLLAAVDKCETESSSYLGHSDSMNSIASISDDMSDHQFTDHLRNSAQLYRDPITDQLFIDPVNTSSGETYDRWTIIDNNMTKDPLNPSADLHIVGDNISVKKALFADFPEQWTKYRQRRDEYRRRALFLAKKGMIADAVLALQHVLLWDRNDRECGEALAEAEAALEDALHPQRLDDHPPQYDHQITKLAITKPNAREISASRPLAAPYQYPPVHHVESRSLAAPHQHHLLHHVESRPLAAPQQHHPAYHMVRQEDVPKPPMSALLREDRDEIWVIPDANSPFKPMSPAPTPEILKPMREIKTISKAHSGSWVESVSFSPDGGRMATTGFDKTAKVWDAERGKVLLTLKGHKYLVRCSSWNPFEEELATASYDHTVRMWNSRTGELLDTLEGHRDRVNSVAWSPTGHCVATGSDDGTAMLWDVQLREAIATLAANIGPVSSVTWNPDGLFLAVAYKRKSVRVWDVTQRKVVFELKCVATGHFNHVAWSPEGVEFAAASTNHTTVVCDAASGDVRLTLRGHEHEVMQVAWSPDGTRLATASKDKTAIVWNALSGDVLLTLKRHSSPLTAVAWRPDGARLATASEGGSITIWECEGGASAVNPNTSPKLAKLLSLKSTRSFALKP